MSENPQNKLKMQFTAATRQAVDWLKFRGAISDEEYKEFYHELVEGVDDMDDEQFFRYLDLIEEKLLVRG